MMLHHRQNSPQSFATKFATVFGLGYLPIAPGTWGSLPGLVLGWLGYEFARLGSGLFSNFVSEKFGFIVCASTFLAILSWLTTKCISQTERLWQSHDDSCIVIDEVLGQAIAIIWFPPNFALFLLAFILFRIFDIWKPGPIGWIDRKLTHPFATLLDDLLAGVYAALLIALFRFFI